MIKDDDVHDFVLEREDREEKGVDMKKCIHNKNGICDIGGKKKPDFCDELCEDYEPLSSDAVSTDVNSLLKLVDWILESKIQLCDKRCLMEDINTEFGNIKSNECNRESCPGFVLKLLADNVRAHFS